LFLAAAALLGGDWLGEGEDAPIVRPGTPRGPRQRRWGRSNTGSSAAMGWSWRCWCWAAKPCRRSSGWEWGWLRQGSPGVNRRRDAGDFQETLW